MGKSDPTLRLTGWHSGPTKGGRGVLYVERPAKMPFDGDECWSSVIFELLNIRNDAAFASLDKRLSQGTLQHSEWLRETARLEYKTTKERVQFYFKYWKPHCDKLTTVAHGITNWYINLPKTFELWFGSMPKDSPYLKFYSGSK
ncbi:MAG: hypothetical protein K2X77_09110 [Candidatus Obscuribacterales bacterium]|nr:hypothetical protein [Candidatus Obscuribacterales bacterium]